MITLLCIVLGFNGSKIEREYCLVAPSRAECERTLPELPKFIGSESGAFLVSARCEDVKREEK